MIRGSASKALGKGSFVLVKMDLCQDITGGSLSTLHRPWLATLFLQKSISAENCNKIGYPFLLPNTSCSLNLHCTG